MVCGRNTAQSQVTLRTSYEALRKDNVCLEGCAKNILHDTRLCTTRSGGAPRCTHTTSIVDFLDYVVVVGPPPPPLPATTLGLYSSITTSTYYYYYYYCYITTTVRSLQKLYCVSPTHSPHKFANYCYYTTAQYRVANRYIAYGKFLTVVPYCICMWHVSWMVLNFAHILSNLQDGWYRRCETERFIHFLDEVVVLSCAPFLKVQYAWKIRNERPYNIGQICPLYLL